MHTTTETTAGTRVRVGGAWLAAAALLLIAGLGLHGPIPPEMGDRMTSIAGRSQAWTVAHWLAAAGLSLYAGAGLLILTSASPLTRRAWPTTAWAVITLGALWTATTAVAEATAVTGSALAGDADRFAAWWSFAEAHAIGFVIFALAVTVIARDDARSPRPVTTAWAAHTATLAGITAFAGWALGMWLGVPIGTALWVAASILVCAWTLWFGIGLARSEGSPRPGFQTEGQQPAAT